jgi:hypothetical protein
MAPTALKWEPPHERQVDSKIPVSHILEGHAFEPIARKTGFHFMMPALATKMPVTVVMTATIHPPQNVPALTRVDPRLRLEDYRQALRFYMAVPNHFVDRILFIDNSNADLSVLQRMVDKEAQSKRVELISFDGNDHPPEFGKGYGEFKLLDMGLAKSQLIRERIERTLWKVTGRLRVLNLTALIESAPTTCSIYCDLRNVPIIGNSMGGNRWMDLRLFSCTLAGYDCFMRDEYLHLKASECRSPEFYFFDRLVQHVRSGEVIPRFRVQPNIAGFGGHRNVDYQKGSYRVKNTVRAIGRKVTPWLWL